MITCSSCGARISKEADQCELCGWPVGQDDHDMKPEKSTPHHHDEKESGEEGDLQVSEKGPFCHMCGWENLAKARFCSSCGTELQEVSKAKKPVEKASLSPKSEKQVEPSEGDMPEIEEVVHQPIDAQPINAQPINIQHMGMLAVAGILIVAALYMITSFSRRAFPEVEPAPQQAQAAATSNSATTELPDDVAARIAELESEAEGLGEEERLLKKREIVSILSGINRPDEAAAVQEEIAEISGTSDDWFLAGHFFYDWMNASTGEQRFAVAQKAVDSYEKGLALNPNDLNVRTALAMSYLNTRAPMQGVQQIRQVLESDPDHLQGNFYYGVMLMQINRTDQAIEQFRRVKELVEPDSPLYQQADMMLQNLQTSLSN